jgi:metal-sulfur cluster biosynthetic enzyme
MRVVKPHAIVVDNIVELGILADVTHSLVERFRKPSMPYTPTGTCPSSQSIELTVHGESERVFDATKVQVDHLAIAML